MKRLILDGVHFLQLMMFQINQPDRWANVKKEEEIKIVG